MIGNTKFLSYTSNLLLNFYYFIHWWITVKIFSRNDFLFNDNNDEIFAYVYTLLFTRSEIWNKRFDEVYEDGDGDGGIL